MTNVEQEAAYQKLKLAHPHWTPRFLSGYIHGMMDEEVHRTPKRVYVDDAHLLDHYALAYLTAFAIHRGEDVEQEKWFSYVGLLVASVREDRT